MKLNELIKKDITFANDVWKSLLNDFAKDNIEYLFTKGSSAKKWQTDIDYVPIISDVDIHVKFKDNKKKLLNKSNAFDEASFFTGNYERLFYKSCKELNHKPIHVPRVQIVQLEFHGRKGYVVPPREQDIIWLQGKSDFPEEMDHQTIREMDRKSLLNEKLFIDSIPETFFELSGLGYYTLLYRIGSRISATPIRLLTQLLDENPHNIWALNKTSIKKLLSEHNLTTIASSYEQYYITGWKLFESSFTDSELYRTMIKHGYYVLKGCYEELQKQIK